MEVIPSIDLRDGKCVRLYQGDYEKETVYSDNPLEVAVRWSEMGAQRIHIVDLDGAATGVQANLEIIRQLCNVVDVPLQVGGGIRDIDSVQNVIDIGVERVILGTSAVEDPSLVEHACRRFGAESIVVGVDARDGSVAIRGWKESSLITAIDLIRSMNAIGVRRFIYTDIARDGTLSRPNFEAIGSMVQEDGILLVASGGISSLEHIRHLVALGVEGAIIGKALYTGDIDLREAMSVT